MARKNLLDGPESFHLEIPAKETSLIEVRDFVADICVRAGFSKRETNNTKLAMDEACTNIIKHAYEGRGGDIRIDVQAAPGSVEMNIFDRGVPFDWGEVEDPDLEEYVEIGKKGGLGIYLMNRLMDELDYSATSGGNRLYMAKRVSGVAAPPAVERRRWSSTLRFKFALRAALGLFGLVLFLWIVQFVNQSRDIRAQREEYWASYEILGRSLETKGESAIVAATDPYSPKYREVTVFIAERLNKYPAVRYARIIDDGDTIVSSSDVDELGAAWTAPPGLEKAPENGAWRIVDGGDAGLIREYHLPVLVSSDDMVRSATVGRIVLGISERVVEAKINDPRFKTTLILAGILMVGIALIYLLISVLVKPIQALTDGVRAIGEGSLEDEIRIDGPEEIGEIASAFNEITAKFRQAQQSVVEQERMQKEMQVAQEIQHSLLPNRVPKVSGYDIASLYRAAKEVGGDYYDFVSVDEDTLGVVVADVSGKGVPGSLVMTMIRTALRMEARGSHSAADVMARMNDFVTEDMKKGMFVTIFYVILDSKNRIISYASAGHNPMILFRAETDETFFLNPRGFPVGISLPDESLFRRSIDVEKIKLKKDDMLVIYTDGVTEAMNDARDQYGEDRLISLLKEHGRKSPKEFIDLLTGDIADFTRGHPQNDDITVVAVKEKMMADEVLVGIRRKLIDLVEKDGLSVAEACRRMKVSPSTFYRYRRRLEEYGERGLKNKELRTEHEIRRVSIEQRKKLVEIVKQHPEFGAKRMADAFNDGKDEQDRLTAALIYDELKRMRLNTYEKRLEYLRRNRFIMEDEYQRLSGSPPTRPGRQKKEDAGTVEPPADAPATEPAQAAPADAESEPGPPAVAPGVPAVASGTGKDAMPVGPGPVERGPAVLPAFSGTGLEEGGAIEIVSSELGDGIVSLSVIGNLDSSSAGDLEGVLESVYEYGYRKIIVDLADVSYISSGGWGIFTGRVKQLREGDGDVVLVGMSPEVYDIYELLGFRDIIIHFQHVDEAKNFLSLPTDERSRRFAEQTEAAAAPTLEQRIAVESPVEDEASPWTPLRIRAGTVGKEGEIAVIELDGVIDTVSCMKLRALLDELIDGGRSRIVIDLSRVEYVSSSGWGVFASRIEDVRRGGGDIKIFGMDPEVDTIFHMLGFDAIMRSFSILAEAIGDFEGPVDLPSAIESAGGVTESAPEAPEPVDTSNAPPAGDAGETGTARRDEAPASEDSFDVPPTRRREPDLRLEIEIERRNGGHIVVARASGAVDASTSDLFESRLDRFALDGGAHLVLDLERVVYISSSGWGVIVKQLQRLGELGRRLVLAGMNPAIFKIFRDLGFEPLVPHYLGVHEAVEALSALPAGGTDTVPSATAAAAGDAAAKPPAPDEGAATPSAGEPGETEGPRIDEAPVEPLAARRRARIADTSVELDVARKRDVSEDKDRRIRELGWGEYGKKLSDRNKTKTDEDETT